MKMPCIACVSGSLGVPGSAMGKLDGEGMFACLSSRSFSRKRACRGTLPRRGSREAANRSTRLRGPMRNFSLNPDGDS